MSRIPWIGLFAVFGVVLAVFALQRLSPAVAEPIVGSATAGQNAMEFVGTIAQDGASFTSYGYITHISGLDDSKLFSTTNPLARNETTARFTYFATATLTSRSVVSTVFQTTSAENLAVYFNAAPHGDFSTPSSFSGGQVAARYTLRTQDILSVIGPNLGSLFSVADANQTQVVPFQLDGTGYQLGDAGLVLRETVSGTGIRTDAVTPKSTIFIGGNFTLSISRSALAVPAAFNGAQIK